jgi:hypothetical protein
MAAEETPRGEGTAFDGTVGAQGFDGIVRAGGIVPTVPVASVHESQQGSDEDLIKADEADE